MRMPALRADERHVPPRNRLDFECDVAGQRRGGFLAGWFVFRKLEEYL